MRSLIGSVVGFCVAGITSLFIEVSDEQTKMLLLIVLGAMLLALLPVAAYLELRPRIWPGRDRVRARSWDMEPRARWLPLELFLPWESSLPQSDQAFIEIDLLRPRRVTGLDFDAESGNLVPLRWRLSAYGSDGGRLPIGGDGRMHVDGEGLVLARLDGALRVRRLRIEIAQPNTGPDGTPLRWSVADIAIFERRLWGMVEARI